MERWFAMPSWGHEHHGRRFGHTRPHSTRREYRHEKVEWTDKRLTTLETTLAASIEPGDGRLFVVQHHLLQSWNVLKIGQEMLLVTEALPDVAHVKRGTGGTIAAWHDADEPVHIVGVAIPEDAFP